MLIIRAFIVVLMVSLNLFSATNILVFGDFGTNSEDQALVAKDMTDFCSRYGCDFAVTLGDNVYPRGVENLYNGEVNYDKGKPNFDVINQVFLSHYRSLKMPFYMTFGNHDVGNEGLISIFKDLIKSNSSLQKRTIALINNQINFTAHKDNPIVKDGLGRNSRMWNFPDDYYRVSEKDGIFLYSINTNTYPHRALSMDKEKVNNNEKNFLQKSWLDENLKAQQANWRIVFGHMPLYTHGRHGWLEALAVNAFRKSIIETLCANKVDFYLAGHDHHLEVDKHVCPDGHVITAVVSGAAAKRDRLYKKAFPLLGKDDHLLWGNGRFYLGDKHIFSSDDVTLGFSYLQIIDDKTAVLRMKETLHTSKDRSDGCFKITKGSIPKKIDC